MGTAKTHHALPDGYADALIDLAHAVQRLRKSWGDERFYIETSEISHRLFTLAEFPYSIENNRRG